MYKKILLLNFTTISNYSRVPNNRAARLLIFPNFSLPTRLIWTYTLIKFQEKILPTRLLCTYTVIDFSFSFQLTQNICYLLTNTYFACVIRSPILSKTKILIDKVGLLILDLHQEDVPSSQTYTVIRTNTVIRFSFIIMLFISIVILVIKPPPNISNKTNVTSF